MSEKNSDANDGKGPRESQKRMRVIVTVRAKRQKETKAKQPMQATSGVFNNALSRTGWSHLFLLQTRDALVLMCRENNEARGKDRCSTSLCLYL